MTEELKTLCNKYLEDEWSLTKEEKGFLVENVLFFSTIYCNGSKTEVIDRATNTCKGVSFDNKPIEWFNYNLNEK